MDTTTCKDLWEMSNVHVTHARYLPFNLPCIERWVMSKIFVDITRHQRHNTHLIGCLKSESLFSICSIGFQNMHNVTNNADVQNCQMWRTSLNWGSVGSVMCCFSNWKLGPKEHKKHTKLTAEKCSFRVEELPIYSVWRLYTTVLSLSTNIHPYLFFKTKQNQTEDFSQRILIYTRIVDNRKCKGTT